MGEAEADCRVGVVIPCFNEVARLRDAEIEALCAAGDVRLYLVDDGSTDGTRRRLEAIAGASASVSVIGLEKNVGKAEAVRAGLTAAVEAELPIVGYLDADFATPAAEFLRLVAALRADPSTEALIASRVALLGRRIERSRSRHYLGRIFATMSSLVLGLTVYDTQCGAKLFRVTPELVAALSVPFRTRWAFDVELLARLDRELAKSDRGRGPRTFVEVPLREWHDVGGSKLGVLGAGHALLELGQLGLERGRAALR